MYIYVQYIDNNIDDNNAVVAAAVVKKTVSLFHKICET